MMKRGVDISVSQRFRKAISEAFLMLANQKYKETKLPSVGDLDAINHELRKCTPDDVKACILLDPNFKKNKKYYLDELENIMDIKSGNGVVISNIGAFNYGDMLSMKLDAANIVGEERREYMKKINDIRIMMSWGVREMKVVLEYLFESENVEHDILRLFGGSRSNYDSFIAECHQKNNIKALKVARLYRQYGKIMPEQEQIATLLHEHLAEKGIICCKLRYFQRVLANTKA